MATKTSHLDRLIGLPDQVDSEERRNLLRDITDSMAAAADRYTRKETENFDHLLTLVAPLMDRRLRRALAMALTKSNAPKELVLALLKQAEPTGLQILRRSAGRSLRDLMADIRDKIGHPVESINMRDNIYPENRLTLPQAFLEAIYLLIYLEHRKRLQKDVPNKVLAVLDRTAARFRDHVIKESMDEGRDHFIHARKEVMAKIRINAVDETYLSQLLETSHRSEFLIALAHKINTDAATLQRILNDQSWESIAIACVSAGLSRNFFVRLLQSMQRRNSDDHFVLNLISQYGKLDRDTAERVMRFLRVRITAVPEESDADMEPDIGIAYKAKDEPVQAVAGVGFGRAR